MSAQDGGPAFPAVTCERQIAAHEKEFDVDGGMSLRDWFAGRALAGLLAGQYASTGGQNLNEVPREAFLIADAMLAARSEMRS